MSNPLFPPRPNLPIASPFVGRDQRKPAATLVAPGGFAGGFDAAFGTGIAVNAVTSGTVFAPTAEPFGKI